MTPERGFFNPANQRSVVSGCENPDLITLHVRLAAKETERTILSGNLLHGGHPILRRNFQNCTIDRDPAGNEKFNKARSAEKIDGAVACAMALARARAGENGPSVYDTDAGAAGLLVL